MTRLAALALLAVASCGRSTLTSPTPPQPVAAGATLTPTGALAIHPHTFGAVLPWHVVTAEASWNQVAPCVGVELGAVRAFPVLLVASRPCGAELAGCFEPNVGQPVPRIEIIAVSHDFDPANPDANPMARDEIARLWRHELIHTALFKRDGDPDGTHSRPEWECER